MISLANVVSQQFPEENLTFQPLPEAGSIPGLSDLHRGLVHQLGSPRNPLRKS